MEPQKAVWPNHDEIADFFEQLRRDSYRQPTIDPAEDGEREPRDADIVLDNTSRNPGVVLAVYGKLE